LARTIDDIAEDAELRVAAHLAAHQMTDHAEAWLAEGTPFIADGKCLFCGQSLEGLSRVRPRSIKVLPFARSPTPSA
jgi:wobble nucleotide-excising tRNase